MALRSSDAILKKNLVIIRHNLSLLQRFIHTFSDLFEWVPPKAGAVCFIKFKGPLSSEEFGAEVCGTCARTRTRTRTRPLIAPSSTP